jgi:hypothetical protein
MHGDKQMPTSRHCPLSNAWIDGVENDDQVAENLRDNSADADPLGEAVYRLFSGLEATTAVT